MLESNSTIFGCMTLCQKCCSSKGMTCPYPNPYEMWSKSIVRELSFYRINHRIMQTKLKMVGVVADEVSFNEVLCTNHFLFDSLLSGILLF